MTMAKVVLWGYVLAGFVWSAPLGMLAGCILLAISVYDWLDAAKAP